MRTDGSATRVEWSVSDHVVPRSRLCGAIPPLCNLPSLCAAYALESNLLFPLPIKLWLMVMLSNFLKANQDEWNAVENCECS